MTELAADQRRLFIAAIVVLALLAIALPIGLLWAQRSGANFAESEEVGVNHLGAATLDIDVGSGRATVGARNMAPGDAAYGSLELTNTGSLPLRYAVTAEVSDGPLTRWLVWHIWTDPSGCAPTPTDSARTLRDDLVLRSPTSPFLGSATEGLDPGDRRLAPDEREELCFEARLPLDASNEAQGAEISVEFVVDAEHDVEPTS